MKKALTNKKLSLRKDTLRNLAPLQLARAKGGARVSDWFTMKTWSGTSNVYHC